MAAETPTSLRLSLSLLGPFVAAIGEEPLAESRTKKIEALLAYLAFDGRQARRRENLVGMLFPEMAEEQARTNLRQNLTRLRRAIRDQEADPPFLQLTRESIQFNMASDHFVDVAAFVTLQRGCSSHDGQPDGRCPECMERLQQALDLYRGPFMDGFFLEDSAAFDDWILSQREWLQEAALAIAAQLAGAYERWGNYASAESVARRQIQMEPWQEEAHQQLMKVLAYQGKRGAALRQYERLAALLMSDLGVEPLPATELLRRQIASATAVRRQNLPARDASFVGRFSELTAIKQNLADPAKRLVSLVGPGGSGKTALAVEAGWLGASQYMGPFMYGIFMVPLAGIKGAAGGAERAQSSYDPLVTAVAEALSFNPTEEPRRELVNFLSDKKLLLILDNVEHVIDEVRELVLDLLRGTAMPKILVTSRTRLNLADEWLVEVGGLPVDEAPAADGISRTDDAAALLVQRAQRLAPEISSQGDVSPGDVSQSSTSPCPRPTIVRICRLVQGLPLGVELAASWVRLLSCEEIVTELEKNLDFLRSSAADLAGRHQSLRAVFDYSWALLDDSDRQILGRLSVFLDAFDRPAAESVAGATVQSLAKLVDHSFMQRRGAGSSSTQRYEILESLRHFAAEKQHAADQGDCQLQQRHSRYYLAFLAERLDALRGHGQQAAVKEIALEISNIRAAWHLAAEKGDVPALARAQVSLALFYYMRSWFAEGENSFGLASSQLLATSQLAKNRLDSEGELLLARLMAWQGWFKTLRGQASEGSSLLQQGVDALRKHDAPEALGNTLPYLAVATSAAGDNLAAERIALEAQQLGRQCGSRYIEAVAANVLSQINYLQGEYGQARAFGQESLALLRESGNTWSMAFSLTNLGRAAFAEADYEQAGAYYQEAIEIRERLGDARGKALGLLYLGDTALSQEDLETARQAFQQSLAIFRDIGSRSGSAEALIGLGHVAAREGQAKRAQRAFIEALELAREGQTMRPMLEAMLGLAQLMVQDRPEQALLAARVIAGHPASAESTRQGVEELIAQIAGEAGMVAPGALAAGTLTPEEAVAALDEVASSVLRSARLT